MQCPLPHEASTTCPAGTEPWASIQLRRRRPKAVDRLAISSQSPFCVVGVNSPIALAGDCINLDALKKPLWGDSAARRRFRSAGAFHMLKKAFVTTLATVYGNDDDRVLQLNPTWNSPRIRIVSSFAGVHLGKSHRGSGGDPQLSIADYMRQIELITKRHAHICGESVLGTLQSLDNKLQRPHSGGTVPYRSRVGYFLE